MIIDMGGEFQRQQLTGSHSSINKNQNRSSSDMRNDILIACLKQRLQKQCASDGPSSREAAKQTNDTVCSIIGLEQ